MLIWVMVRWDPFVEHVFNCTFRVFAFYYQKKASKKKRKSGKKLVLVKYYHGA